MPEMITADEVITRKSAVPAPGDGNVVMSTMRNRSRVIGEPVLLVNLRLISRVPSVYGLDAGGPPLGAEGVRVSL